MIELCLESIEKSNKAKAILIEEIDNVATLLNEVKKEEIVDVCNKKNEIMFQIIALENIPKGNKIALKAFSVNDLVIKYRSEIGRTTRNIEKGKLVHVHNVKSLIIETPHSTVCEVLKTMKLDNKLEEIDE